MVDTAAGALRRRVATWRRRLIEGTVAVLAFVVWGVLAYTGFFRLYARFEGLRVGGHWALDAASLFIGVSGSIAGIVALWALVMRSLGRSMTSVVGAPDDTPEDRPHHSRSL